MEEQEKQLEEIFSYYGSAGNGQDQETLVSLLREIQELYGFISPEIRKRAADTMGVKESVLTCLIRRFPSLKEADYQHTIVVCTGERCGRKQGEDIIRTVAGKLGIDEKGLCKKGQMLSPNGKVLLKTQNCLKQCRTSPNLMIDGTVYRQIKPEDVAEIIRKCF
ncbi:MAG: NAD(P)H-dependent oxidoreductase subunit E [Lachnospiraceae bacterium]|nr:NAD(P)H-dependent oxidoreductase subunit E [Lachnospiraceae bacterium]